MAKNDLPQKLFDIGKDHAFIKDETGKLRVSIPHDWHADAVYGSYFSVTSEEYASWLTFRYRLDDPKAMVKPSDIRVAVHNLRAAKDALCVPQKIFKRFGHKDGAVYLHLGGRAGKFVAITADGWDIRDHDCPVAFTGELTLEEIPEPVPGGSLAPLEALLPAKGEAFRLIVGWLLMALCGQGPYPVLNILGPHGSAKTTMTKLLRRLIDPVAKLLTDIPISVKDLNVAAHANAILCINNASELTPKMSDALCRIATEGGSVKRKLYTDGTQFALDNFRPVILNGITRLALRADLQDRSIEIELPPIPVTERRYATEVEAAFEACRPAVLGALLDGLVVALRDYGTVELPEKPRMADFVRLVTAAEPAFGWAPGSFLAAFMKNQEDSAIESGMESPALMAIKTFMETQTQPWAGTATDLHQKLSESDYGKLPPTVPALGRELRRIAPQLPLFGIWLTETRTAGQRNLTFSKAPPA